MKLCPVCQRGYPDAVGICAEDGAALGRYDLRAALRERRRRVGREMFAPLVVEGLPARLGREAAAAGAEFRRHPRQFVRGMLCGDADPVYRRSFRRSAACALIAVNACLSALILVAGVFRSAANESDSQTRRNESSREEMFRHVANLSRDRKAQRRERGRGGRVGGSQDTRERGQGGGGGGNRETLPAQQGGPALPSLMPQLIPPRLDTSHLERPSLTYPMTIVADPRALPPPVQLVGDPDGVIASNSSGQGENGGMGRGRDGGLGAGAGGGFRFGYLGNTGGQSFRPGGGPSKGPGNGDDIPWASERIKPQILYKEKARYTEDARVKQVQGAVVLRATFSADGRITDIFVVRGLPEGLTEMAIEAAQRIRFRPAIRDGVPVSVRASLEYNFVLY
jgi:TonB family protein